MFRRRLPGRPPPRRRPRGGPREAALRMLRRANHLMEIGQYEQAYPLLKRLADGATQHGMPVRAANLYLQAARARLEMGSAQDAVDLARHAISMLARVGQVERVRGLLPRMVGELEKRGHHDQAIALRAEIVALVGSAEAPSPSPPQRGTLPVKCPSCNAPVRADEVDWVDNNSAECVYCGSVIRTE